MTVPRAGLSLAASIEKDKEVLGFETIRNKNTRKERVVTSLTLPSTGIAGTIISWSSDNEDVINPYTGAVIQDNALDKNVTLTATISKDGSSDTKVFNLTVPRVPANNANIVLKDYEWLNYSVILATNRDNRNITNNLTKPLPTVAPNSSTISWSTSDDTIITTQGDVIRDEIEDKFVTLIATITKGAETKTKLFIFKILKKVSTSSVGNNTDVTFKRVEESNEDVNTSKTISVTLSEDNVDVNTTLSLNKDIKLDLETIISQGSVKNVLALEDKIVTIYLNNDGSTESKSEFVNENNETVISQVNMASTNTNTTVDENGSIESNLVVDVNTTVTATINEDGSVIHVMETKDVNNTNVTSTATSKLAGSEVVFKDETLTTSFTKTTTNNGGDTVIVEAIIVTSTNGTSTTKFQTRNLTTGETTEIESTMKNETPYEAGNEIEIDDINGTLYIRTIAPLDANLIVE